MFSSSLHSRPQPQIRISAQKRHRAKLPSFVVQSQNQIITSFLHFHESVRDRLSQEHVPGAQTEKDRDNSHFMGLVRKLDILQKTRQAKSIQTAQQILIARVSKKKEQRAARKQHIVRKPKAVNDKSLAVFFRYQLVSLCALIGKREEYLASLRIKKSDVITPPLTAAELDEKLKKFLDNKLRDKGRQNFNVLVSDQLRSLKYKKKITYTYNNPFKSRQSPEKEKEDQEEVNESQEQPVKEEKIDLATWRRRYGVRRDQKVFIIKSGYQDMRRALLSRGWFENEDVYSPFFDFKWTTKIMDIDFQHLFPGQTVNHFNNNQGLTSKFGLARSLRTLVINHHIDIDRFFPRCYDLGDQPDFQNFMENFKIGFAETVVRRFLVQPERYRGLQLKMRLAIEVLQKRLRSLGEKLDSINNSIYPFISPEEWATLTQTSQLTEQAVADKLKSFRKEEALDCTDPEYQNRLFELFHKRIETVLNKLKDTDPQITMNGYHNIWVVKPNYLSRGRGIRCFNNLFDIVDYCYGKDIQYVAQKYIENPLVIHDRKFDIRQWVLIQDFNPPKIWFFEECYVRFCTESYSLENINNRFIHLTNNSIQKHSSKFHKSEIPGNMWTQAQFAEYIGLQKWTAVQEKMKNIVVWSIKSCEASISARRGSCELVGYDFMIDEQLNPWLIEINMSPAMDYSTPITKRLVKCVLEDTVKVIVDAVPKGKNRDTGMFKCIYQGEDASAAYSIYKF